LLALLRPRQSIPQYFPPRPAPAAPAPAPVVVTDPVTRLKDLAALHDAGSLSDEEFAAAKQIVLAG
jgi:hypothetical protein